MVRQHGTTLVELVIAMTVALLVLGTVGIIFGGTSRNRASLERAARLADNAHYALDLLRYDVLQAGYYDTLTTNAGGFAWQLRDPCVTALADLGWSNPVGTPPPVNAKVENAPVPISGIRAGVMRHRPAYPIGSRARRFWSCASSVPKRPFPPRQAAHRSCSSPSASSRPQTI